MRIVAAVAAVLLLSACSGAPEPDGEIVLTEMAIAAPAAVAPGTHVWEVRNTGQTHHSLTVCRGEPGRCDGEHLEQQVLVKDPTARDPDSLPDATDALVLGSGWTNVVQLDLAPGTYRLWCGVPNHAARGMETMLTVN